ncbi:MAG: hypothetical protein WBG19_09010 [Thermoplasmata archaeon]
MVLPELFVAVLIAGVSCLNAAMPFVAWSRSRDGRFLMLAGSNAGLVALGAVWAWGQLPVAPPSWAVASLHPELLVLAVALLSLATTLWPRHV